MAFWDDILAELNTRSRPRRPGGPSVIGDITGTNQFEYPGSYPAGSVGSGFRNSRGNGLLNEITGIINRHNGAGWSSNLGADRSLSGGIVPPWSRSQGEIGSGVAAQISPPGDSLEDIMRRLEELQDPSKYMGNEQDLERQAMAAASAQYDPVISQLQQQQAAANERGQRNKVELGNMYNSLSGSLRGEIPGIQKQYATDKKSAMTLQQNLQGGIKQQYNNTQKEQEDLAKRLGIEAAAPEMAQQQQTDRDFFVNQAGTQGQTEQAALGQEERGTVDYTREGGQIARFEGTNRQADLMAQLQDLMAEYEGKIGDNKAAKNQAYIAGLGQLQQGSQQSAYDQADRAAKNFLTEIQLGRDLRADDFKYSQHAEDKVNPVKSPGDISNRVLGMGLNTAQARGITDVMMSMLSKDPVIQDGRNIMTGQAVGKEGLANRIVEEGRRRGFSSQAINALMTVALEYFGRR